jgi:hypothetical protein
MRLPLRILAPIALVTACLAPAGAASAAPAEIFRSETSVADFNTCSGESLAGTGTFLVTNKQQRDGSFLGHFELHATATGDQGNEYVVNWSETFHQSTDSYVQISGRLTLISKGSAPNEVVIYSYDSISNEFTTTRDCKGLAVL